MQQYKLLVFKNPFYNISILEIYLGSSSDKEITGIWLTLNSVSNIKMAYFRPECKRLDVGQTIFIKHGVQPKRCHCPTRHSTMKRRSTFSVRHRSLRRPLTSKGCAGKREKMATRRLNRCGKDQKASLTLDLQPPSHYLTAPGLASTALPACPCPSAQP